MNFYLEWERNLANIIANTSYTKRFLLKDEESLKIFNNATYEELVKVCKFLLKIPISNFIYCINEDRNCDSSMIPQFSNFEHGIIDVAKVLKFNKKEMSFSELGKIIIKAKEDGACKKYGENHAKLACELSMVKIERKKSYMVSNTSFGNFSVNLSDEDRIELVKRLILRNEYIQKIIYLAKKGPVSYMNVASETLSESTAVRRKSNIRKLIYLVVENDNLIRNIMW